MILVTRSSNDIESNLWVQQGNSKHQLPMLPVTVLILVYLSSVFNCQHQSTVESFALLSKLSERRSISSFPRGDDLCDRCGAYRQRSGMAWLGTSSDSDSTSIDDSENSSDSSTIAAISTTNDNNDSASKTVKIDRTSFDEAGRSLLDEADMKRMNEMGDFDVNPNSSADQMEQMRAAIRARTEAMGLEKSKVSADYIAQRQQEAISAGSAKAATEATRGDSMFGGLDLSQISTEKVPSRAATKNGLWQDNEEEMPSMFYDPEDELSMEERAEVDPVGQKNIVEQGLNELKNAKWPSPLAALREVALMIVIVAITGALIIGWDKLIRTLYTDILHFIPSKEDLANYMNRFDGLDLPSGWTDNMNDADVASFSEKISTAIPSTVDSISIDSTSTATTLPDL